MGYLKGLSTIVILILVVASFYFFVDWNGNVNDDVGDDLIIYPGGLIGSCSDQVADYNDFGNIHIDGEGNTILTGNDYFDRMPKTQYYGINHDDESKNLLVVKFDQNGSLVFSLAIGGAESDYLTDSEIDSEDNIIISGKTSSSPFLNYTITESGLFIIKISPIGEIIWDIIIDDVYDFPSLSLDQSDNIYLLGDNEGPLEDYNITKMYDHANRPFHKDYISSTFLLKFSPLGEIIDYVHIYGSASVYAHDIKISNETIYLLLDIPEEVFDTQFSHSNAFVTLNSSFDLIWAKGISANFFEFEIYNQGILYSANNVTSNSSYGFISYLNGTGEEQWTKTFDIHYGLGPYIHPVGDNVYYTLASSLYRLNASNDPELIMNFTGKTALYDFTSRNGNFVIFGETSNSEILSNASFQQDIIGIEDTIILSFGDIENVTPSNWNDKLLWGTYFGGETYTYQICLD